MANTRDIKRQIVSVKNTQKVTKAMKMVSAAKMRKAVEAMNATRTYSEKIREVAASLSGQSKGESPFLKPKAEVKNIALIVVSSDRGLCGGFNSNINRLVLTFAEEHSDASVKLFIVGKKAFDFFKRRNFSILEKWIALGGKFTYDTAREITGRVKQSFLEGVFDELYLVYNEFRSVAYQAAKLEKLLPLSFDATDGKEKVNYIFEPTACALLDEIVPRYIDFSVYHALLESGAGEHGARMVAMDNATRSADDMIKKLVLNYNKARQQAITMDLLDIVNGAEALK
ncbi:MAG: ATP synthase F1 subunit gamma [Deferribacteraceae bacterium]|jgi:F-type H+-transporting ATPase subunit gamma|nr:ATP synthase F1 subunit gamma [Deferribacteraceae bacterium]